MGIDGWISHISPTFRTDAGRTEAEHGASIRSAAAPGDGPRRSCESEMKMMMLENGPENVMSTPSMFYKGQPVRA